MVARKHTRSGPRTNPRSEAIGECSLCERGLSRASLFVVNGLDQLICLKCYDDILKARDEAKRRAT